MAGWTNLRDLIKKEIIQRKEEGCNVEGYHEKWEQAGENENNLMDIYNELIKLEVSEDFKYFEPTELNEIRKVREEGPRRLLISLSEEELINKFHGAWLGRTIGCALGKPLECGPYFWDKGERPVWKNVELWFKGADAWPISNYTPKHSRAEEEYGLYVWCHRSTLDDIKFMETDDDIRYTVLGLKLLEEKGLDWDSWDLGKLWHNNLTYGQVCTAETQAYLNFAQVTQHLGQKSTKWGNDVNWVRTYLNPYREWIGAQIRIDAYGYAAAGNPELAAELAWRDASFSHVKNGVYGAMFFSAVISAAFAEKNIEKLIEIGLSEIPKNSRLYDDIRKAVEIANNAETQLELAERIYEEYKHYDPTHTNNNAAICVAALLFAKGDFEKAITTSVLCGWDTDCNGATVGSVMGAIVGAKNIPEKWSKPLNDTIYTEVPGFSPIAISECAERSYQVFKKINR